MIYNVGIYNLQEMMKHFTKVNNTRKDFLLRLQFRFSPDYPIESPEVLFIGNVPLHEHIYSNGFICMSILYDGKISNFKFSIFF